MRNSSSLWRIICSKQSSHPNILPSHLLITLILCCKYQQINDSPFFHPHHSTVVKIRNKLTEYLTHFWLSSNCDRKCAITWYTCSIPFPLFPRHNCDNIRKISSLAPRTAHMRCLGADVSYDKGDRPIAGVVCFSGIAILKDYCRS